MTGGTVNANTRFPPTFFHPNIFDIYGISVRYSKTNVSTKKYVQILIDLYQNKMCNQSFAFGGLKDFH